MLTCRVMSLYFCDSRVICCIPQTDVTWSRKAPITATVITDDFPAISNDYIIFDSIATHTTCSIVLTSHGVS